MNIKRIVLLGHNGFIGGRLWDAFGKKFPGLELIGRSFPEFDLTRPESVNELKRLFNENTVVVMCSAIKRQFGDDLNVFEKNVRMCLNVARAIEATPVARFLFFSSMAVYGEDIHNLAINEDSPICLRSYYGLAKYTGEGIFERVFSRLAGACATLRPPVIYGPGDAGNTYGPAGFLNAAVEGQRITLWGDGTELREFVYIDDIVEIVSCLLMGTQRGIVNVVAGRSYSFQDIIEEVKKIVGREVEVVSRPRSKDKVDNAADAKKIQEWLGEYTFTPLSQGLQKMFGSMKMKEGSLRS